MIRFCSEFINVNSQLNDFQHVLCRKSPVQMGCKFSHASVVRSLVHFAERKVQKAECVKVQNR